MKSCVPPILSLFLCLGVPVALAAPPEPPELINYQGRLVRGTNLINGVIGMEFVLADSPVGGTILYQEKQPVTVVDGLYAAQIGVSNAVPGSLIAAMNQPEVWLEVSVDGQTILPRERLVSVPYAMQAHGVRAEGVTSDMLADGSVNRFKIAAGAVGSSHIASNAIAGYHIGAGQIGAGQLGEGAVTRTNIADGAISVDKLQSKYAGGTVSARVLQGGPVNSYSVDFPYVFGSVPIMTMGLRPISPFPHGVNAYVDAKSETGFSFSVSAPDWPVEPIQCNTNEGIGWYNSLYVFSGIPAVACMRFGMPVSTVQFIRAQDANGSAWYSPVMVATGQMPSLSIANGRPAVAFYDHASGDLKYCRANNTTGSSWGAVVAVYTSGDVGSYASMANVGHNPAIAFFDATKNDLLYVRSADGDGTTWSLPIPVVTNGIVGRHASLKVVNGRPAISYFDQSNGHLMYVRASDAAGSAWSSPVRVDTNGVTGLYTSLALVNGNPAIGYYADSSNAVAFVRANDVNGETWGAPVYVDRSVTLEDPTTLAEVDSRPVIAYRRAATGDLVFCKAADASGTLWGAPVVLDASGNTGSYPSMASVNGQPGIAYKSWTDDSLKFIRVDDFGVFVDWIALEP